MGHLALRMHLEAPIERVFDLCADITRFPEWVLSIERVVETTGPGDVVGTTYREDRPAGRAPDGEPGRDRGGRSDRSGSPSSSTSLAAWRRGSSASHRRAGGTDLAVEIDLALPMGIVGQIVEALLVGPYLKRHVRENLRNFRTLVETNGRASA